jgi:hypothetical protein
MKRRELSQGGAVAGWLRAGEWLVRWGVGLLAVLLVGCGHYVEREQEVGYRGAARLNPYLAAERFLERLDREVAAERSWPDLGYGDAMVVMPAAMLSAEGFVRQAGEWVNNGGHLVCLFDHADTGFNDWHEGLRLTGFEEETPAVWVEWLKQHGVTLAEGREAGKAAGFDKRVVRLDDEAFEVSKAGAGKFMLEDDHAGGGSGKARTFVSLPCGRGRVTLVADARMFRNRWIGEAEHAALLGELAAVSRDGTIRFVLGSGVSFWAMVWRHAWQVVAGLLAVTAVWLWRWMPRFGPRAELVAPDERRDYLRHLAAVGGFFWRLDRGAGLLGPLRAEVIERLQRRFTAAGGKAGEDIFALAETISGVPRDRAQRALTDTTRPDPARFTHMTADLQQMLNTL